MAKKRYYRCDDLPPQNRYATGMCENVPPSYETENRDTYLDWLKKGKEASEKLSPKEFQKEGFRREAHIMVPGGRTQMRFPGAQRPKDAKFGGPKNSGEPRTTPSLLRLTGPNRPYPARTQSEKSHKVAAEAAGRWYIVVPPEGEGGKASRARVNPGGDAFRVRKISEAIEKFVNHYNLDYLIVPSDPRFLTQFGFPPAEAKILVDRAAGKHFFPDISHTQTILDKAQEALGGAILRSENELLLSPGRMLKRHKGKVPEAREALQALWPSVQRRGLPILGVFAADDLSGKRYSLVPVPGESASSFFNEALPEWLSTLMAEKGIVSASLFAVVAYEDIDFEIPFSGREHSKWLGLRHSRGSIDYKRMQNVPLEELPLILVRSAQRRSRREGRRLNQLSTRTNPPGESTMGRKSKGGVFGTYKKPRSVFKSHHPVYEQASGQFGVSERWTHGVQPYSRRNPLALQNASRIRKHARAQMRKKFGANWAKKSAAKAEFSRLVDRALSPTARKRTTARKSRSSAGLSKWQRFLKTHGGKGYSMAKLKSLYRKAGKAASSSKSTRKASKGGLTKWQRFLKTHGGKGYSMAKLKSLYRKSGKATSSRKASSKGRSTSSAKITTSKKAGKTIYKVGKKWFYTKSKANKAAAKARRK